MSLLKIITLRPEAVVPAYRPGHYSHHEGRTRYNAYWAERVASLVRGPVLDVGCGVGHFLSALSRLGVPATGFDISREAVDEASQVPAAKVLEHDANEPWPFTGRTYAAVTFFDVIEHFENYDRALQEAHRVLTDDGWLLVVTVNRMSALRFLLGSRWGALKDPDHVVCFDRRSLGSAMERNGFRVVESRTFFNFGVAGESAEFLRPFRHPGLVIMSPEFGDSIHVIAQKRK